MSNKKITKYQPNELELEEYKKAIEKFGELMLKELIDNHDKGGRSSVKGWLWCQPKQILNEVYYHTGKLQEAIRHFDHEGVREYAADVANLALMIADIYEPLTRYVPVELGTHPINEQKDTI